jgi:membrane associated rhomboid family serine protease
VQTGGASGAVFGVAGAATLLMMRRGITFWNTGFGPLLVINLLYTFAAPNVSVGGHIGGLIGGTVAGFVLLRDDPTPAEQVAGSTTALGLAVVLFVACLWVAARAPDLPSCHLLR